MDNITKISYDSLAEAYDKKNATSVANAFYERPAIISLLPKDIKNKVVVDAGCGSGTLGQYLEQQGAQLIAFDYSEGLINLAKKRLKTTNIRIADLKDPLDFIEDASVDTIISSLVLHYIENWTPIFAEFNRILKSDGCIIFSIHHPHQDWYWYKLDNYFQKILHEESWNIDDQQFTIQTYHRTLQEVFDTISQAHFNVEKLLEPFPLPEGKNIDPRFYESLVTKPRFLFVRLKKK